MTGAITLTNLRDEPRVESRDLAARLRNQHKNVLDLIQRHSKQLARFGKVAFETLSLPSGQKTRVAYLNEDQAYFVLALSRNTVHVVGLKSDLIQAFSDARAAAQTRMTEYEPTYRALHDKAHEPAAGSRNEKFVHMNLNSLVNRTVGIEAGQRRTLAVPVMASTILAQSIATKAMAGAQDHRDGFQRAKIALGRLQDALAVLDGPDMAAL